MNHSMVLVAHRNCGNIPTKGGYASRRVQLHWKPSCSGHPSALSTLLYLNEDNAGATHMAQPFGENSVCVQQTQQDSVWVAPLLEGSISTGAVAFQSQNKAAPCTRGTQAPITCLQQVQRGMCTQHLTYAFFTLMMPSILFLQPYSYEQVVPNGKVVYPETS